MYDECAPPVVADPCCLATQISHPTLSSFRAYLSTWRCLMLICTYVSPNSLAVRVGGSQCQNSRQFLCTDFIGPVLAFQCLISIWFRSTCLVRQFSALVIRTPRRVRTVGGEGDVSRINRQTRNGNRLLSDKMVIVHLALGNACRCLCKVSVRCSPFVTRILIHSQICLKFPLNRIVWKCV